MRENVKNLPNHVVGQRFHNKTKPRETFHCALHCVVMKIIHFVFIVFDLFGPCHRRLHARPF